MKCFVFSIATISDLFFVSNHFFIYFFLGGEQIWGHVYTWQRCSCILVITELRFVVTYVFDIQSLLSTFPKKN